MSFETLLSPVRIGKLEIRNRFVVPPMGTNFGNPDGSVSRQLIDYYAARAKGGFGLIIVEVAAIDPLGRAIPNQLGIWSDDFIPGLKKLVDEVHKLGAKVAIQLHHAGRQTARGVIDGQPVAPSAVPCPVMKDMPRELRTEEVYGLIQKFRDAAVRARRAGFDAVEIHGAHGYLISQFMSTHSNKRIDKFGGNFLSRMKFPSGIVKGVRQDLGPDFPILFRISADEKVHGGRTIYETKATARLLEEYGVDAMHVSICTYGSMHWMFVPPAVPQGFNTDAAAEVKRSVTIPVIAVGRIHDPFLAEDILLSGKADMISMGRASLSDPEIPNKVAENRINEISPCIACLQGCVGNLFNPDILKVSCLVNPLTGREGVISTEKTGNPKKVVVVGSGPGGLKAAYVAAQKGHDVICYEKSSVLGGQFRIAGIPSTKHDILTAIKYYITMGRKYGVTYKLGVEVTTKLIEIEKPDVVILATGGVPLIPKIKGIDNPKFLKAIDIIDGKSEVGEKVLVIGGGMVGSETAEFIAERGSTVTILEMLPTIAKDVPDGPRIYLLARLGEYGVKSITNAKVTEFHDNGVTYLIHDKEEMLTGFDSIVLAMGSSAYNPLEKELKNKVDEVYVIGDAMKARKAISATEEALKVAASL
ncbi:MAG: FAD-dependent oxidoreductase [Geobacteraceae bacterium]|nr:FAD-dependent oxidoreductase [Geobacteraceae bacterium]